MKRTIVFIIPDERKVYEGVNVKVGAFHLPSLAVAVLGALARQNGYTPFVMDLTLDDPSDGTRNLDRVLSDLDPEFAGITCTSATFYLAIEAARRIREISPQVKIMIGGPHVSSLVEETLRMGCFDYIFIGEAEQSFQQFLQGVEPSRIDGIAFRDGSGAISVRASGQYLKNLDDYPFPDYSLFNLDDYHIAKLQARRNPVVWIETSRGCPFDCKICNKVVHGQNFRPKSVDRVLAEIRYLKGLGVREIHIADDGFTSDMKRAELICDRILAEGIDISWSCVNGIRVDRVSSHLLEKMKAAGRYRISFGIESGNQRILDNLGKHIKLEQIDHAVRLARRVGIEVFGFFIFGFEDDNGQSMQDTIEFAKKLPLDLAKASIMMPFPGSPLYDSYLERGLLFETEDYRNYNAYIPPHLVYRHPVLDWECVIAYQKRFYRSFYFNPRYIARRLAHSIKTGSILSDIRACLTMQWFGKGR